MLNSDVWHQLLCLFLQARWKPLCILTWKMFKIEEKDQLSVGGSGPVRQISNSFILLEKEWKLEGFGCLTVASKINLLYFKNHLFPSVMFRNKKRLLQLLLNLFNNILSMNRNLSSKWSLMEILNFFFSNFVQLSRHTLIPACTWKGRGDTSKVLGSNTWIWLYLCYFPDSPLNYKHVASFVN